MADSLLDIGNIGQLAQNNVRNVISLVQLDQREQEIALDQQRQMFVAKQAYHTEMMDTYKLAQDPQFQFMPEVRDKLLHKVATMAGSPIGAGQLTDHMKARDSYLRGLASNNKEDAEKGLYGLLPSMPPAQLDELAKLPLGMAKLREQIEAQQLFNEMNAEKATALRRDNALVNVGKPIYTAVASAFRDALGGTDSKEFQTLQALSAAAPGKDLMSKPEAKRLGQQKFAHLLGGQTTERAMGVAKAIEEVSTNVAGYQKALTDAEHGIPIPKGTSREELMARLDVESTMLGAYRDLQSWYESPLDKQALGKVRKSYELIEEKRKALDKLEQSALARTSQYQQDALALRQSEAGLKHASESAFATASQRYLALPSARQTSQEAARIAGEVQKEMGVPVNAQALFKNPNAPQSVTNLNLERGLSTKAADRIDKGATTAEQAVKKITTINRMMDAIATDNVNLGPGATVQQYISQLSTKIGAGGKTVDERVANTRTIIQGLADLVLANRHEMEGQGQVSNYESQLAERAMTPGEINQFTVPELKSLMAVADRAARFEYGLHENRMKALRQHKSENVRDEAKFFEAPPLPPSKFGSKPNVGPQAQPQSGGATLKSLPQGSKQIGTSNGKPVYETPDGKRWIGE